MTLTLDLSTAWVKVSTGELLPEAPGFCVSQERQQLWQQEMLNAQSRKVAFLYQLFKEHGTTSLLQLQTEFSNEEFCKLLNMTPATYKISQVARMTIQDLIASPFRERGYGTFVSGASTLFNTLSVNDIEALLPLFMRCMREVTKREILTALHSTQAVGYNSRVTQIRRIAWLTYLEAAHVVIIDASYSKQPLALGIEESDILVGAAENSPDLRKLILKNYQLSDESATILKDSSKEIDTSNCQTAIPFAAKISLFALVALVCLVAIVIIFDPFSSSDNK